MKKIIITFCAAVTLTACTQNTRTIATPVKQNQKAIKRFTQWCQDRFILPEETKHTVEVLLEEAGTQNCEKANRKLSNLIELSLWGDKKISDLAPLASLTNLIYLDLRENKISNLKPLSKLTNLTHLGLEKNIINDNTKGF